MPKAKSNKGATTKDASVSQPEQQDTSVSKETKSVEVLDITKLTPKQLAELQKQLKEHKAEVKSQRDERNTIIVDMLQEKDGDGNFANTTRDIAFALTKAGLTEFLTVDNFEDESMKDEVEKEIRKVQAKKQHLEKLTDEKGELVYEEGTFGYKRSDRMGGGGAGGALAGSKVKPDTVVAFFEAGRVGELTKEQKAIIAKALS